MSKPKPVVQCVVMPAPLTDVMDRDFCDEGARLIRLHNAAPEMAALLKRVVQLAAYHRDPAAFVASMAPVIARADDVLASFRELDMRELNSWGPSA